MTRDEAKEKIEAAGGKDRWLGEQEDQLRGGRRGSRVEARQGARTQDSGDRRGWPAGAACGPGRAKIVHCAELNRGIERRFCARAGFAEEQRKQSGESQGQIEPHKSHPLRSGKYRSSIRAAARGDVGTILDGAQFAFAFPLPGFGAPVARSSSAASLRRRSVILRHVAEAAWSPVQVAGDTQVWVKRAQAA